MPRSASPATWAEKSRANVRSQAACPTCHAPLGEHCTQDDGSPRVANHAARHEAATGQDPTRYAYGNQRARRGRAKERRERRTPGGW